MTSIRPDADPQTHPAIDPDDPQPTTRPGEADPEHPPPVVAPVEPQPAPD